MGSLRLGLALLVVVFHLELLGTGPLANAGTAAVQIFFLLSGFTIALLLAGRDAGGPLRLFYAQRLLRLLPVFLAAQAFWVLVGHERLLAYTAQLPPQSLLYYVLSNVTMLGADITRAICFPTHLGACMLPTEATLDPPAWSLGPEIAFYLVAPFLVRRPQGALLLTIAGAVVLHLTALADQPAAAIPFIAPWKDSALRYGFYGASLVFFGLGALAWHVVRGGYRPRPVVAGALVLLVLPIPTFLPGWLALAITVAIPALAARTRASAVDRFAGALSYPVYLVHFPVMYALGPWSEERTGISGVLPAPAWIVLGTLAASVVLHLVLEVPVERFRRSPQLARLLRVRVRGDGGTVAPVGVRTLRVGRAAAAAYLALPFLVVCGIALAQTQQEERVAVVALARVTDARWVDGIGHDRMEILVTGPGATTDAFPYFARVRIAGQDRWVHHAAPTAGGLAVRLLWQPLPGGGTVGSVPVTRKVQRAERVTDGAR
ncbi:MAG: acyltransferase family protein [Chloroflexota bacterium]